ncbi:DUF2125 domain-containing protein [Tepidamorphus sp. 3E244]|uniref:DUF2125 domain-containing protein n=1 Tax=Tepidamorphus sp. 3E244 TaxID=3385498 RepID=UPI0038FCB8A7
MNTSSPQFPHSDERPRRLKRRPSFGVLWPTLLVVILAVAWSGYWYVGSLGAQEGYARWKAQEVRDGREFACDSEEHGGYPFRFEIRCTNPVWKLQHDGRAITVRAQEVHTVSMAYQPNRVIAEFDGPLYVERDDGATVEADWEVAQMSLSLAPDNEYRPEVTSADLSLRKPLMNVISQPGRTFAAYRGEAFQFHMRKAEGAARGEASYDLAFSSIEPVLELSDGTLQSAERIDYLGSASQVQALYSGPWTERMRKWRNAGGQLKTEGLRIEMQDSLAILDGAVRLDSTGRPEGLVNLTTAGLDISKIAGDNSDILSGIAAFSIGALGTPVTVEGRNASRLTLRVQGGTVYLGPIGLTQFPSLTGE